MTSSKKKPSAAQLAARKKFAQRAKSGEFTRKRKAGTKKSAPKKKAVPKNRLQQKKAVTKRSPIAKRKPISKKNVLSVAPKKMKVVNHKTQSSHFSSVEERKEYHPNGKLSYIETLAKLQPSAEHLYEKRFGKKGNSYIRIGENAKYNDKGRMVWRMYYDRNGKLMKKR